MFQRILVPLDGSMRAERALPVAARIARATGGSMVLLRVVEPPVEYETYPTEGESLAERTPIKYAGEAADYLGRVARCELLKGIPVVTEEMVGAAEPAILDYAVSCQADLMVLCSHGSTGFKRWAIGSVADKVVRHAPMPVLILREGGPTLPIPDAAHPLRVLVTLDGSELSEAILEPVTWLVKAFASPSQGGLHLLHVVDPSAIGRKYSERVRAEILEQVKHQACEYLTMITSKIRTIIAADGELPITCSVVIAQDVATAIIGAGESREDAEGLSSAGSYDMIAMSTHGRGALARWMVGSITERVLHATALPMFIVRPQHVELSRPGTEAQQKKDGVKSTA
jgi:nucleotide-binding universal stress UspA family protein